ncbi:MAG: hypothetical protein JXR77_12265 [Lentisphaeria bacterium]|nr:hypothetical protein [Lentisphaeria bacterium]
MRFATYGRTYQLVIDSAASLAEVLDLDESHWVATSAPTAAFRCDAGFLAFLDADGSGRITSDEVRNAVRWLLDHLADPAAVPASGDSICLDAIAAGVPDGQALLESAQYVLTRVGDPQAKEIRLEQIRTFVAGIQARPLNGDGIVPPEAAADAELAAFIRDVMTAKGSVPDSGGRLGIGETHLSAFMAEAGAYVAWRRRGEIPEGVTATAVMPLGTDTPQACALVHEHAAEIEAFFAACRALRFDCHALPGLWDPGRAVASVTAAGNGGVTECLKLLPLARPVPEGALTLSEEAINPHYDAWLQALRDVVLRPLLGHLPEALTRDDWQRIRAALAPHEAYLAEKPAAFADGVPLERLEHHLDSDLAGKARDLIAADRRVATILRDVRQVERLILYARHLLEFVNNFVSFPYLYAADRRALFEMGSAVVDGRWLNFAVRVDDVAAHSTVAKTGDLFIVYLEVTGKSGEGFKVGSPLTSGTRGNITLGKRGVFFDVTGREYDAKVIQIVENPISLSEALAAPFVRLWRLIQGRIETWSGAAEKELQTEFDRTLAASKGGVAGPEPVPAAGAPGAGAITRQPGFVFGLGMTAAALGSAFAFVTKTFSAMQFRHVLFSFLGAAVLVVLPITLIAFLKLRRQDLSVLLEGCGWAVNARMRLHRKQRRQFTCEKPYPLTAVGAPRHRRLLLCLWIALAVSALAFAAYWGRRLVPRSTPATGTTLPGNRDGHSG